MKIVILEPIGINPNNNLKLKTDFEGLDCELITYDTRPENEEEVLKRALNANVIVLSNLPIYEQIINNCKNLKMISVAFAGVDHLPMELCRKKNIVVPNAAGYSNHAVAELTIGSVIHLFRKLKWCDQQTRKGLSRENFLGSELYGKTFGIIGLGQIGQEVAKLANAFGCNVIAYNKSVKNISDVKQVDLETLLRESDIVSLHIPLTESTKGLIGKNELELMKSTSILINTARGPAVNYFELKNALDENKIAGAAIDVYEKEPPLEKDYPLFDSSNTILLPHIGYATKEAIELRAEIVIENIKKWLTGNPQNIMN